MEGTHPMSKLKRAFIFTGVVALLGGLGTAAAVSSCDAAPCEIDPYDPACSPEPYDPRVQNPGGQCDLMARPSVQVVPVRKYDDFFMPVEVEMVLFEHEGQTHEARCVWGDDGCSNVWIAGYELTGPIKVSTQWCETEVSQTVEVGLTDDECHAKTEYVLLEVSTRGCLTAAEPDRAPPGPGDPWLVLTKKAP